MFIPVISGVNYLLFFFCLAGNCDLLRVKRIPE